MDVPALDDAWEISSGILGPEAAAYHQQWMEERQGDYDPQVLRRLQNSVNTLAVDYIDAKRRKALFTEQYNHVMSGLDVLISPTEPITAPKLGEDTVVINGEEKPTLNQLVLLNRPFNLTGMPSISVPCGFDEQGLPVGLQIAGKLYDEAMVLKVAYAYEQATTWHERRPNI